MFFSRKTCKVMSPFAIGESGNAHVINLTLAGPVCYVRNGAAAFRDPLQAEFYLPARWRIGCEGTALRSEVHMVDERCRHRETG